MRRIVEWRNEFPRLYELYELSEESHPDNYFPNVLDKHFAFDPVLTRMSFGDLERALECLDKEAWKQLVEKARPLVIQRDPRREWSQMFNHLYEAFGYEWLAQNGYTSVRFVERSETRFGRTPELVGESKTSTAVLEVKTINCSEDEIDRSASWPPPVLGLGQGLSDGFKRKFVSDLKNAREQLEEFDQPTDKKIVLLVIRLDCQHWCSDKIYQAIKELASMQSTGDFEVVVHQMIR